MTEPTLPESDLPKVPFTMPTAGAPGGNAFAILGHFRCAALDVGWPDDEVLRVIQEATSGDYAHLRATIAAYCEDCDK